ncbi:transposase [Mangrovimonas sp. AS39]|nr:transposase [Mangrovimonas futianensis]MCF1194502.1 transposase [Mangrovimonas futianensis]
MQNGYIEQLNRFYREDVLDAYGFEDYITKNFEHHLDGGL